MWVTVILLTGLLIPAFVHDVRSMRIPNYLTFSGTVAGLLAALALHGIEGIWLSFCSAVLIFIILFLLFLVRGVGAGDVKLFTAIGAIAGFHFSIYVLMYSVLYAGVIAGGYWLYKKMLKKKLVWLYQRLLTMYSHRSLSLCVKHEKAVSHFPFMLAVIPGVITASWTAGI